MCRHFASFAIFAVKSLLAPFSTATLDAQPQRGIEVAQMTEEIAEAHMNQAATISDGIWRAILWAGLAAGFLDITAAFVVYGAFGARPMRILQGIAGGLLGPGSFDGGIATALLGLLCHFFIAYSAATVFFLLSRKIPFLVQRFILSGVIYGIAVYFFMNRVVVPLSNARKYPFSLKMMLIGIIIHIFCVGLPIATSVRRFSTPKSL